MNTNSRSQEGAWARHALAHAPSYLAATALFALMAMTFADVVLRSVFNSPISAATELTRLFMAITVFSSLPVISWRGEHIVVDLLDPFVRGRAAQVRDVLIDALAGIVIFWPAIRVYELAERAKQYGDTTEYLQIPQFYIAYFIAFSTFVTALILLLRAVIRAVAPDYLATIKNA
ncbi:TRAP transporter small permease [Denitrobaculum tricleocarpae]|uniref:TRAP transporter small permease protein n=1 Tax=Denitrobaculum tricleocarpae TaxID=2591009 RepID=A0A545TQX9_9PROT|nr:TRAP transporter small permease [Denitrobaculum tricleocarpae]TQV79531.1 TRAP transporter small permease [Denitrobaculum tricleocarpae]